MGFRREELAGKLHVLVIPFPAQGHMNPMMQFAKRLSSKGLRVTLFAATTTIKNSAQLPTTPINLDYISYEFDEGDKPTGAESYLAHIKRCVSQNLPGLIQKHKQYSSAQLVLVYDSHLPWAGDIGHGLGVKVAPFFTQAAGSSAIYYHVHKGNLEVPTEKSDTGVITLPAMPVLKINDLPSSVYDGLYPSALDLHVSQFENLDKADWILFNTFDELESEVVNWLATQMPIKTIGPTIPSMYLDKQICDDKDYGLSLFSLESEACIKWLDTKQTGSVVYVSFGSIANLGQDHMDQVALGLLKSNHNFLWVVRESEQSKLPIDFASEAAKKGLIVGWCPQIEVLAHKAVGSFMTHCGWNSTLEALSLGVPMLAMPQWTDQMTNAKYVADVWRTGVYVKAKNEKEIVTKDEIVAFINDVMEGEKGVELRANAMKWKELATTAMKEGGNSDKNIDEFILSVVLSP